MGNDCEDKETLRAAVPRPVMTAAEKNSSKRQELTQSTPNTRFKETKSAAMLRGVVEIGDSRCGTNDSMCQNRSSPSYPISIPTTTTRIY